MKKIFCLLLIVSSVARADMLWKPEAITYELKQAHPLLRMGLMLELNQSLKPGEMGWKQARLDVPENWQSARLEMSSDGLLISVNDQRFILNGSNQGALAFEILDGGNKTDSQLLTIWQKHAGHAN